MAAEAVYPVYPAPPPFNGAPPPIDTSHAALLPNSTQQHSQVDFDQLRSAFEAASLQGANGGKQRFSGAPGGESGEHVPPMQPQQMMENGNGGYVDIYSNGYGGFGPGNGGGGGGNQMYSYGPGAPQYFPQGQQQQLSPQSPDVGAGAFSGPTSPYLGVNSPNLGTIPFPSPANSNGALPSGQSYNGSNFPGQYDNGVPSPNPYTNAMPSPNPYSPNPYATFGGLGFGGVSPGFMGMFPPGMMASALSSPGLPPMSPTFGALPGFPAMGQMGTGVSAAISGRTVYVGNLPADASVDELLSQVRFGPIDSVKILPEKSCAFISFLDPTTASAFHSDALMRKIRLHEQDLKIGWGKPSAVSVTVLAAVQQSGTTRNVYLGNLPESVTEQTLRDDLSRFGPIDQVKIVRDKNIGFVHFLSIATAIKVVSSLANEPDWAGRRVAWGKDRCAYVPKNQHQQQQHNMAAAARGTMAANYGGFGGMGLPGFGGFGGEPGSPGDDPNALPGNRTVYLGNVHPETTTEEICNTIRGGILQQIRYIPDKHICFVTFVDAQCALAFYQTATYQGIALHNRRLKVGWGKHSGPPSPGISMVVQAGGSRNVYVGNIEDFDFYSEEKLRHDFGEYGEIELVNTLREKQCAFVNFTNIASSIKAIESIKSYPDYAHLKIAYGKDRAGNPPRNLGFGGPGAFTNRGIHFDGNFVDGGLNGSPDPATFDEHAVVEYGDETEVVEGLGFDSTVQ